MDWWQDVLAVLRIDQVALAGLVAVAVAPPLPAVWDRFVAITARIGPEGGGLSSGRAAAAGNRRPASQ